MRKRRRFDDVMKLIFERDIPEFKGKTWRERYALRQQAVNLDWRIRVRRVLIGPLAFVPLFTVLMLLAQRHVLPSLGWVFAIYVAIGFPLLMLFRALWVNPLIKNALQNQKV
jgi:hypothetical protein